MKTATVLKITRKRKRATRNIYITVLVGSILVYFSFQRVQQSLITHHNLDVDAHMAAENFALFRAWENKSAGFYSFCLLHAIYHEYLNKGRTQCDSSQSLYRLRQNFGLDFNDELNVAIDADENDKFFEKYSILLDKIHDGGSQLKLLYRDSATLDRQEGLSNVLKELDVKNLSFDYIRRFIPDTNWNIVDWLYAYDPEINPQYDENKINSSFEATNDAPLYENHHSFIHQEYLAHYYYDIDTTGSELFDFLKKMYIQRAEPLAIQDEKIAEPVLSSISIFGTSLRIGLLLYLVAPLIVFFSVLEFNFIKKIVLLNGKPFQYDQLRLFDSNSFLDGLTGQNVLSFLFKLIEAVFRISALFLILDGCFGRYNGFDPAISVFNSFIYSHNNFNLIEFDLINLLCLIILLSIYSFYQRPTGFLNNKNSKPFVSLMHLVFYFSMVVLPLLYFVLGFYLYPEIAKEVYNLYPLLYFALFLISTVWLYTNSLKAKKLPVICLVLACLPFIYILPLIIKLYF